MKLQGASIKLINFGLQLTRNFYLLQQEYSQNLLSKIIYNSLHDKFEFETQKEHNLKNFSHVLVSFFLKINSDSPHFEFPIISFFSHVYVYEYDGLNFPDLLKINNKIYFTINDPVYPPEILSVLTKKDCSLVFDVIHSAEIYREFYYLKKYIYKNSDDNEYLLLPEIPAKLQNQIYNLYDLLLTNFDNLDLDKKYEEAAEEVFDYLITMKDFFDTK
jgi:hypothetical protein